MSFEDQLGRGPTRGPSSRSIQPVSPVSRNSFQMSNYSNQPSGFNQRSSVNSYEYTVKIVSDNIRTLSVNVASIRSLSETLGTSRDSLENRDRLRHLIDSTRMLSSDTNTALKQLHDFVQQSSGTTEGSSRRVQQQKLVKDFQTWLHTFQDVSKAAAEKEKTTPIPQKSQPAARTDNYGYYDDGFENQEKQSLLKAQQAQQLQIENERNYMDAIISDREQDIRQIEKTVVEVNEIFRDLSHLVSEQGVMIDHIESNIDESVSKTDQGVVELRKANEYQKSSRNKMCCLALILLIICGVAVLFVYLFVVKK